MAPEPWSYEEPLYSICIRLQIPKYTDKKLVLEVKDDKPDFILELLSYLDFVEILSLEKGGEKKLSENYLSSLSPEVVEKLQKHVHKNRDE